MGDCQLGVEHAFLAMIRHRETVPARALAGLADLDALPEGTTFGFNHSGDERTWMHVIGPDRGLGPEVTRQVLNTALVSLGCPGLGS